MSDRDSLLARSGVVASTMDSYVPYFFRTYDVLPAGSSFRLQRNPGPAESMPIWMVGRAATAAPLYFGPLITGGQTFLDGGLTFANNPSVEAYQEVEGIHRQYVQREKNRQSVQREKSDSVPGAVSLFISIGSGNDASIKRHFRGFSSDIISLVRTLVSSATDTQRSVHALQAISLEEKFPFFRFNVDRGVGELRLDEWKRPKKGKPPSSSETLQHIERATHRYLEQNDTQAELDKCARLLISLRRLRL